MVIKGLEVREGKKREAMEEFLGGIRVKTEVEKKDRKWRKDGREDGNGEVG